MDRNALDWLFSTAPQALAALVGLIFAGVAFIVGAIDKQVEQDDSREDICKAMKQQIHVDMKWLFWLSGISIILDLVFLLLNPIEEGSCFSFDGTFSPYLLMAGLVLLLNVGTLIYSLCFIIKVASPDYFMETVKRLSEQEYEDKDHFFTFELSHYFQNKDQMAPYRPGSGAIAESIDHLLYKLKSYVNQVQPDASYVINSGF